MSRFAPKVPIPPPLGAGFVHDPATGLYSVTGDMPQILSGPLLGTDLATIVRDAGTAETPNLTPYSAAMSAVLTGGAAPAPSSGTIAPDGTLSGLPSTIVAGQPLSATTYTPPNPAVAFMLHRVATNANEGLSWLSGNMPGTLNLLIPQNAGAYTVRSYAYPGPSSDPSSALLYESAQFNVTAAPGTLPAAPTQTADTGRTSSGVTMTWSATAASYRVLARNGVGSAYGSLIDTTVQTNSYMFTGLAANASPRAVVVPQNADGCGIASAQFISSLGSG